MMCSHCLRCSITAVHDVLSLLALCLIAVPDVLSLAALCSSCFALIVCCVQLFMGKFGARAQKGVKVLAKKAYHWDSRGKREGVAVAKGKRRRGSGERGSA